MLLKEDLIEAASVLLGLPLRPEFIRLMGFAVAKQVIHLDIKGICPACMIRKPAGDTVEQGIRFVVGANRLATGAWAVHAPPVHTAGFSI